MLLRIVDAAMLCCPLRKGFGPLDSKQVTILISIRKPSSDFVVDYEVVGLNLEGLNAWK